MVARFSEQKDHELLLQAIARIKADRAYEVDLVGDGPLMEASRRTAEELGIGGRVRFLGARNDVPQLLAKAQAFLLISKWEGFPRSILEAMRAGLPVIASDVGGVKELVKDGETGFLIPRGDLHTMIDRIGRVVEEPVLRITMGKKNRRYFLEHFTYDRLLAKTTDVYREVAKRVERREQKGSLRRHSLPHFKLRA
jgi:glycosyltransferase involved in cell wall biosynthesis